MPSARSRLLYGLAAMMCACAASSGCASFAGGLPAEALAGFPGEGRPAQPQAGPVLGPRACVQWSISSPDRRDTMTGAATVGPDGSLELGPFGAFSVAGLTPAQAQEMIQRQLAAHVRQPRVRVELADALAGTWRPVEQAQHKAAAQPASTTQFATSVRSNWKPAQREGEPAPASPQEPKPFPGVAAPRAEVTLAQAAGPWQPAGRGLVQRVNAQGPEAIGPPLGPLVPEPVTGPGIGGPVIGGPGIGGPVIGGPIVVEPGPVHGGPFAVGRPPCHRGLLGKHLHGRVIAPVPGVPNEQRPVTLPTYRIAIPDILQIDSLEGLLTQPVRGPHLVRPDGTVGVGVYGPVYVAGLTLEEARVEIAKVLHARLDPSRRSLKNVIEGLSVDVLSYNSRVYYVITDRLGSGEVVERIPVTGNETVLDAISQIKGLPPESSRHHIWVARRNPGSGDHTQLRVDWAGITKRGEMGTNYQIYPGDRIYVRSEAIQKTDNIIAKFLSPIQRVLGAMLLGSETVNSIRTGTNVNR